MEGNLFSKSGTEKSLLIGLTDSLFFLNKKVAIKIPTIQDLTKKQLDSFRREVEIMRLNFSLFNILEA